MKPTEQLKEEHQAIKLMLRISEKICEKLEIFSIISKRSTSWNHERNLYDRIASLR